MDKKPRSREKRVTDNSKGVHKRGSGLGSGPVGNGGPQGGGSSRGSGGGGKRASGGGKSPIAIIIGLIILLVGGGGGAMSMLGGGGDDASTYYNQSANSSWSSSQNTGKLDTSVAKGSREKYTKIVGDGSDTTTIMVYMCGTDLESRSGMASSDIKEMASATTGENINLIVYTGGCSNWKISGISSKVNQIYQIKDGKMYVLEKNMGDKCMTKPETLTEFIKYCKKNFPANRNDLILWDHGGGSISGYGYDEKNKSSGSMNLSGIRKALNDANMKFDFIGFDACLMATAENALMLNDYADYLIASEETEPGIGWYYTDWLNAYAKDPSMDTINIGKNIIDGFVDECAKKCRGQLTTLSIIDLAEFANTIPDKLKSFSVDTSNMIQNKEYKEIATARQSAREFAISSKIDQVDFVDLAKKMDTDASNKLAEALLSSVKYNRTSNNMTNAYGVSVYFPNKKTSYVDNAVKINNAIGVNSEFNRCIQEYASLQLAGQAVATGNGATGSPFSSLIGELTSSGTASSDLTSQLLTTLLTSGMSSLTNGSTNFLDDRAMSLEDTVDYIADNQFDTSALVWKTDKDAPYITISKDQWSYVTDLEMNMFYDDGEGYIDLGLDNMFKIDDDGNLIAETDKTWLAINGQPVAYYHTTTVEDGDDYTITGYVPAMLNGERVNLLLTFDQDNPYGFIAGVVTDYNGEDTETVAKAESGLEVGDTLEFLCDYYTYDGDYKDSYYLGEPMKVTDDMEISNVKVGEGDVLITYKVTDIYGQEYWTPIVP